MTVLVADRRRAAAFAQALQSGTTPHDPDVLRLLRLARALRPAPLDPPAAFRENLRAQLLAAAARAAGSDGPGWAPPVARRPPSARRRLAAAVTGAVLAGGLAGTAVASEGAVPGEPLYGVKRGVESVRLALAFGDVARGQVLLDQARQRQEELSWLLRAGPSAGVRPAETAAVLADLDGAARAGSRRLLDAHQATGRAAPLQALDDYLRQSLPALATLADRLPPEDRPAFGALTAYLTRVQDEVTRLLSACTGGGCGTAERGLVFPPVTPAPPDGTTNEGTALPPGPAPSVAPTAEPTAGAVPPPASLPSSAASPAPGGPVGAPTVTVPEGSLPGGSVPGGSVPGTGSDPVGTLLGDLTGSGTAVPSLPLPHVTATAPVPATSPVPLPGTGSLTGSGTVAPSSLPAPGL